MQLQTFAGRRQALETLNSIWAGATAGNPQIAVIEGAEGSGRRTLVSELLKSASTTPLHVRLAFNEGEDGLKILLRMYAAVYTAIHDNPELKASLTEHFDALLADIGEPQKQWLMAFREGIDKERPDLSAATFQVTIPRQSPYLAIQEILALIAPKHPVLFELGDSENVLSFTFWAFVNAFLDRIRFQKLPILPVFWHAPLTDKDLEAAPFVARNVILENHPELPVTRIALEPLSLDEFREILAGQYPNNRFPAEFAPRLHELSGGLPGRLADLLELMEDKDVITEADDESWILSTDLAELKVEDLLPDLPAENASQARQVLQVAAREGRIFTAAVISEQLQVERDTVDDLLDELEDHVEEVIFHEGLQSWLYRFKSPFVRQFFADDLAEPARTEMARGLGELLERSYLQRSVEYAIKSARLHKEAGDARRSTSLLGLAASAERPDILQMGAEIVKSFPGTRFPAAIYKGLHLTMFEKLVPQAPVEFLMGLIDDVEKWAAERHDEDVTPWLAYYRARLLQRAGNLKEAEKHAERAQKGFAKANNAVKEADALNVLGLVALIKGDIGAANEHVTRALKKTEFPPIKAQAMFIKGLVHKGRGELQPAIDNLKVALELSGRTGLLPLHLDSGLNIAEILLMAGKGDEAHGLLNQLLEVARQTKQGGRERATLSLLSKLEASRQNFQAATDFASQSLKLSRELKLRQLEAADLLDLGIFSFVRGQLDEANVYLREAEKIARELQDPRLLKEVLFHTGMAASGNKNFQGALKSYQEALIIARELKDERREANILFNIGGIYLDQEEYTRARNFLDQAAPLIDRIGTPDEKNLLKKAQAQLENKLH